MAHDQLGIFKAKVRHAACGDPPTNFQWVNQNNEFKARVKAPDHRTITGGLRLQASGAEDPDFLGRAVFFVFKVKG
jgi:hypothetical protein